MPIDPAGADAIRPLATPSLGDGQGGAGAIKPVAARLGKQWRRNRPHRGPVVLRSLVAPQAPDPHLLPGDLGGRGAGHPVPGPAGALLVSAGLLGPERVRHGCRVCRVARQELLLLRGGGVPCPRAVDASEGARPTESLALTDANLCGALGVRPPGRQSRRPAHHRRGADPDRWFPPGPAGEDAGGIRQHLPAVHPGQRRRPQGAPAGPRASSGARRWRGPPHGRPGRAAGEAPRWRGGIRDARELLRQLPGSWYAAPTRSTWSCSRTSSRATPSRNRELARLARRYARVPVVATNDVHYHAPGALPVATRAGGREAATPPSTGRSPSSGPTTTCA